MKFKIYVVLFVMFSTLLNSCEKSESSTVIVKIKYKSLGQFKTIRYHYIDNNWLNYINLREIESRDEKQQIVGEFEVYTWANKEIDLGETKISTTAYNSLNSKALTFVLPRQSFENTIPNKKYELLIEINMPNVSSFTNSSYLRLDSTSTTTLTKL